MPTIAGVRQNLKQLSRTVTDNNTMLALLDIENKIIEMDNRLTDLERRVKNGGL